MRTDLLLNFTPMETGGGTQTAWRHVGGGGWMWSVFCTAASIQSAFSVLTVFYPSWKTYRALESGSLRASQSMLIYWCISTFLKSLRHCLEQLLGAYSHLWMWKIIAFGIQHAPLVLGPDRLYSLFVQPLFRASDDTLKVSSVLTEAGRLSSLATEVVATAIQEGDVHQVTAKVEEVAEVVREDSEAIMEEVKQHAANITETVQQTSAAWVRAINRHGALRILERGVEGMVGALEKGRDWLLAQLVTGPHSIGALGKTVWLGMLLLSKNKRVAQATAIAAEQRAVPVLQQSLTAITQVTTALQEKKSGKEGEALESGEEKKQAAAETVVVKKVEEVRRFSCTESIPEQADEAQEDPSIKAEEERKESDEEEEGKAQPSPTPPSAFSDQEETEEEQEKEESESVATEEANAQPSPTPPAFPSPLLRRRLSQPSESSSLSSSADRPPSSPSSSPLRAPTGSLSHSPSVSIPVPPSQPRAGPYLSPRSVKTRAVEWDAKLQQMKAGLREVEEVKREPYY